MKEDPCFKENFFTSSSLILSDKQTEKILKEHLFDPARNLLARPKKSLRSKLLRLGYEMAKELARPDERIDGLAYQENLGHAEIAIELIHAGSLIIDDIQDQSEVRRGSLTLHKEIGIPRSITVGNWLYFSPMTYLQRSLNFEEYYLYDFIQAYLRTMDEAHCGQALDISIAANTVSQNDVTDLVRRVSIMKTGSLTRLAILYGALCFRKNPGNLDIIQNLGESFGVLLQAFDDIGNAQGLKEPAKKLEDVKKNRLTFILAVASQSFSPTDYQKILSFFGSAAIDQDFEAFSTQTNLRRYCEEIMAAHVANFMAQVERNFPKESSIFNQCDTLCNELKYAYKK